MDGTEAQYARIYPMIPHAATKGQLHSMFDDSTDLRIIMKANSLQTNKNLGPGRTKEKSKTERGRLGIGVPLNHPLKGARKRAHPTYWDSHQ